MDTDTAQVMDKVVERVTDALSKLGPDAIRIYGEMVKHAHLDAALACAVWFVAASLAVLIGVAILKRYCKLEAKGKYVDASEYYAGVVISSLLAIILLAMTLSNVPNIMYPEAAVIKSLLTQ